MTQDTLLAGRYRLEELLGRGGMGEVHRAVDTQLGGRVVAVKRLLGGADPQTAAMLRREGELQANIRDKRHVVDVYDVIEEDGSLFVVMEFVEGGRTLDDLIADDAVGSPGGGALSVEEAIRYFTQACAGLASVHASEVLHGDVKALNFLITPARELKLIDFGLSRIGSDANTTQAFGTARNTAPEVFDGALTPATDVYALGFTFYELFLGRQRFAEEFPGQVGKAASPAAWTRWHLDPKSRATPAAVRVPELPQCVSDILARMMEKDSEARIGLDEALELLGKPVERDETRAPSAVDPARTRADDTAALVVPAARGASKAKSAARASGTGGLAPWMIWVGGGLVLLIVVVAVFATAGDGDPKSGDEGSGDEGDVATAAGAVLSRFEIVPEGIGSEPLDVLGSKESTHFLRAARVAVRGRLENGAAPIAEVIVAGTSHSCDVGEDGTFGCQLELPTSEPVRVQLRAAGLTDPLAIEVVVDTQPPVVVVEGHAERTRSRSIDLTVQVDEANLHTLTIADDPWTPDEDGTVYAAGLALTVEGDNRFEIVARDRAGNRTVRTISIVRDTTGPALAALAPAPDTTLEGAQDIAVTLRFDEPISEVVIDEDIALSIENDGITATGSLRLPDMNGDSTRTWRALDALGNRSTGSFTWTIDSVWGDVARSRRDGYSIIDREPVRDASGRYPRVIRHDETGIEFIYVPGGTFTLGDIRAGLIADDFGWSALAERRVEVSGFYLARTETTGDAWQRGGGEAGSLAGDDHPVAGVTWGQVTGWCLANGFVLPTEAQWEYAASGPDDRTYPWGNDDVDGLAHLPGRHGNTGTVPAGSIAAGASWCGVLGLAGNVSEWCRDGWSNGYADVKEGARDPVRGATGGARVVRGGGFEDIDADVFARTWFRRGRPSDASGPDIGFRPARMPHDD